jgi:hypothetical protein
LLKLSSLVAATVAVVSLLPALRALEEAPADVVTIQLPNDRGAAQGQHLAALRLKARARIEADHSVSTSAELADIEAQYRSAHLEGRPLVRPVEGPQILRDLAQRYPRSNRAGCAVLELAQLSTGITREQYLREAIALHGDAWFESGVQVGALARAMLALHLAGLERFDEAERVAAELVERFPGAIDQSGATLDDTLKSIKLLRFPN